MTNKKTNTKHNRIISLLTGIICLLLTVSACSSDKAEDTKEDQDQISKDLSIYITSDIHYLSDDINDHGSAFKKYISGGDGKQLEYIEEITDAFVYEVKETSPDVLIISGDLTCNGEKASHKDLAKKLKRIEENGTEVYVIPGNHDINNPWARGFKKSKQYVTDYVSKKDFKKIYNNYGYEEAISTDENSLSYLTALSKDLWLFMIDTSKYKDNLSLNHPQADGIIGKGTFDWMEECTKLAKEKGASIITVMHHNVLHHNDVIQEGYTLNNYEQTQIKLRNNQLNLVFSGHIHIQDISSNLSSPENPIYEIASNALSVYPHQYGVINYNAASNSIDYATTPLDVENWARINGQKDENLLNFTSYSEEYFGDIAYHMAYKNLKDYNTITEEEREKIASAMKTLNCRYFAGRENLNSELLSDEIILILDQMGDGFFIKYLNSILIDQDMEDNTLNVNLNTM